MALTNQLPLLAALGLRTLSPEQVALLNASSQQPPAIPSLMQLSLPPGPQVPGARPGVPPHHAYGRWRGREREGGEGRGGEGRPAQP